MIVDGISGRKAAWGDRSEPGDEAGSLPQSISNPDEHQTSYLFQLPGGWWAGNRVCVWVIPHNRNLWPSITELVNHRLKFWTFWPEPWQNGLTVARAIMNHRLVS